MKYPTIDQSLFILNRKKYANNLKNNSLAIFNSSDEFPRSGDQSFVFKQNPDLFYLSGIDQEQTILLLYPDCPNPLHREVLFLRQTNDYIKVWEGYKYTKEQAKAASGIQSIYWLEDFDNILHSIVNYAEHIYLNTNENDRYAHEVPYRDIRFIEKMKSKYPLHHYERSAPIMRNLRAVKSDVEIELTKKASAITRDAFIRVLKFTKPGVKEYEIEAEIIHEFVRQGATGHAYTPIIASGHNANILHYNDNNQTCKDGDVILFDFGAEYANYNADMSRSIPVNGRFTQRQKDVYNAVLHVMKASIKLIGEGIIWNTYHEQVGEIMTEQLINLGLISTTDVKNQTASWPAYKKYFMHGTSHHLGIDVHDFAGRYTPFANGNILTVEPGIYIPEEGLGIRLENNILITANGNIDLMADIPLEAEEIEEIMNS
ncbi:aminopeptidase P family protein [Pedobacter alluvionis]|uniref:Xaa-Pro aminopeptidase n=1 Tax=Pedobacter alluvionis TaxID=475253 RepID=A0A497Y4E2_9SPHI|nr:aminopeptidase P family protein [Pedobacter alluvionis]RLJ77682.1 Xaa-Pro aminopeptidase [Pedobacter alluvionis]TFB33116.1 aminopeptidase P family protein [Pedobacter alluvionis]